MPRPTETTRRFDLLIIGGGMVGAALGCAVALQGLRVALVEGRPPQRAWPQGEVDVRVSALSRASQRMLGRLGAWERMVGLGVSPYREMRVWAVGASQGLHFDCAQIGEPDLGHIVENRVTQLALWERLEGLETVTCYCPERLVGLHLGSEGAEVVLGSGTVLGAALVVGADGRDSRVRSLAGIRTQGWDYDQRAIVANVRPERWHDRTAWQRFLPTGPLAFLPLQDGRCAIVWSADEPRARELMDLGDEAFAEALGTACGSRLGPILEVGPRSALPLRAEQAAQYVLPGLALIGDAAHAVHPLAGQGVNLGFLDAATLAEEIRVAREAGRPLGSLGVLRRYERARWGHNLAVLAAMDGFKRLFGSPMPPLAWLRVVGLTLTDGLPPLKALLMRQALGLSGEIPPLARP